MVLQPFFLTLTHTHAHKLNPQTAPGATLRPHPRICQQANPQEFQFQPLHIYPLDSLWYCLQDNPPPSQVLDLVVSLLLSHLMFPLGNLRCFLPLNQLLIDRQDSLLAHLLVALLVCLLLLLTTPLLVLVVGPNLLPRCVKIYVTTIVLLLFYYFITTVLILYIILNYYCILIHITSFAF